jgi:hypothetical protein
MYRGLTGYCATYQAVEDILPVQALHGVVLRRQSPSTSPLQRPIVSGVIWKIISSCATPLQSVASTSEKQSRCSVVPRQMPIIWDAEIVEERKMPCSRGAPYPGRIVDHFRTVRFQELSNGRRRCECGLHMPHRAALPGGACQTLQDTHRATIARRSAPFKQIIEAGAAHHRHSTVRSPSPIEQRYAGKQ